MSPATRAKANEEALRLSDEMDLAEVRRALKLSQDEIAQTLGIGQGSVAKIEQRTDMYVSTLRRFIEAMGGELEIVARFPDHAIKIKTFADSPTRTGRSRRAGAVSPRYVTGNCRGPSGRPRQARP